MMMPREWFEIGESFLYWIEDIVDVLIYERSLGVSMNKISICWMEQTEVCLVE